MPLTKNENYFKRIIYVSTLFLLCLLLFSIYLGYQASIFSAKSSRLTVLNHKVADIEAHFARYADDLLFLASVPPIQGMIRAIDGGGYDTEEQSPYRLWVRRLNQIYEGLGKRKSEYRQLRFLDEKGQELVRVDFRNGKTFIISGSELQRKADRYYFSETMKLSKGQVFVSRLDLNQERGAIEVP